MTDGRLTHSFATRLAQEGEPAGRITHAFALRLAQEGEPAGRITHVFVTTLSPNAEPELRLPLKAQDPILYPPELAPVVGDQDLELPRIPIIDPPFMPPHFFPPSLGQELELPIIANDPDAFPPSLALALALPSILNTPSLFALTLSHDLELPAITPSSALYPPAFTPDLQLPLIDAPEALYPPSLVPDLELPAIPPSSTPYPPSLEPDLELPLIEGDPELFPPEIFGHEDPIVGDACEVTHARLAQQFKPRVKLEKLICVLADPANPLEQAAVDTKGLRGLESAHGAQLDKLGQLYRVNRDGQFDETFRVRLRAAASMVLGRGRPRDLETVLSIMDDGFAPSSLRLVEHHPAALIMTAQVETQRQGERIGRMLRRSKPAGVGFVFLFEYPGVDHFVWSGDTGEGWAEEDNLSGTGGIWAEGV